MSEKVHQHDHANLSGDLSAEGSQSAWPPSFSVTANPADPGMGKAAQRNTATASPTRKKPPVKLSSLNVPGVPQDLLNKIAGSEGIRLDVYADSLSIPTVGIGHKLSEAEKKRWKVGDVLDESQIVAFAQTDIGLAWQAAVRQCAQIGVSDSGFRKALFEVNFQLGIHWNTKHTKTWAHMRAGHWEKAAQEAANSKWNAQTPQRVTNFQKALRQLKGGKSGNFDLWNKLKTTAMDSDAPGKEAEAVTTTSPQVNSPINSLSMTASVGRGGKNLPDDLQLVASYLQKAGAPPVMLAQMLNPMQNGQLIARYQKEVLGFSKADGRIDPGGKTFQAISKLKGRNIVKEWYSQPREEKAPEEDESLMDLISEWMGMGEGKDEPENEDLGDFKAKELPVKKYWVTQTAGQCDVYTKKVITKYAKDHPELYKDLGGISSGLTAEKNSLHLAWEDDFEKGVNRTQGKVGGNDISTLNKDEGEWSMAIRYINACLSAGVPAMVGVNHTFAYKKAASNNDNTTDHWLTIIGRGSDEKGKFFIYTDPGTKYKATGTSSENNRLYQTENLHIWRDETKYTNADSGKGSYTLVAVTLYDKHRGKSEFSVGGESFKRNKQF